MTYLICEITLHSLYSYSRTYILFFSLRQRVQARLLRTYRYLVLFTMAKHCKEENMEIIDAPDAPGTNQNSLTVEQEREEKQDLREKVELQFRTLDSARRITPVMFIMCLVFGIAFSPAFLVDSFVRRNSDLRIQIY